MRWKEPTTATNASDQYLSVNLPDTDNADGSADYLSINSSVTDNYSAENSSDTNNSAIGESTHPTGNILTALFQKVSSFSSVRRGDNTHGTFPLL